MIDIQAHNTRMYFEEFAEEGERLEVLIEAHRDRCKWLVENYVSHDDRTRLLSCADDRAYTALHGVHALAHVADEADSLSRHLRVNPKGLAA